MNSHRPLPRRRQRGITLIELVVVISLVAIVLAIGIPSFQGTIERSRLQGVKDNLQISLLRARSEAAKRNGEVAVCPIRTPGETSCATQYQYYWQAGWLVYYNGDGTEGLKAGATSDCSDTTKDCLISIYQSPHNPHDLVCVVSTVGEYRFSPGGTVSRKDLFAGNVMRVCNRDIRYVEKVTVDFGGRVRQIGTSTSNICTC